MFEDSTFESTGKIRTRSRRWMVAALFFNGSILLALILIPLVYPEALPRQDMIYIMQLPPPPPPTVQPRPEPVHPLHDATEMPNGQIVVPRRIPPGIAIYQGREDAPNDSIAMIDGVAGGSGNSPNPFFANRPAPTVHAEAKGPLRLPSSLVAGLLIRKTIPVYPPIAKAAHQEGTVILQATISAAGTIENLRVDSGPLMLRQAALDAVQNWRYRPYELNGAPVEVETTVNVVFRLAQ